MPGSLIGGYTDGSRFLELYHLGPVRTERALDMASSRNKRSFSSSLTLLVTSSGDKTARLWDLTAKDPAVSPVVMRGHENPVTAVGISGQRPGGQPGSSARP